MSDFRTDEEKLVDDLTIRIAKLEEAIDLIIAKGCDCSFKERYSGHLSECFAAELQELMHPSEEER